MLATIEAVLRGEGQEAGKAKASYRPLSDEEKVEQQAAFAAFARARSGG